MHEQEVSTGKTFIVRCSPEKFEHAAWLSAIHSEVLSVNEKDYSLHIFPLPEMLKGQLDKLGASVSRYPSRS